MPTILITGGTGMIGTALSRMLLEKGYNVIILSRKTPQSAFAADPSTPPPADAFTHSSANLSTPSPLHLQPRSSSAHWDPGKGTIDPHAIREADYIIHLAGAGIADKRWSARRKKEIVESRTGSSALIVKALQEIPNKVQAVVSASAIGWYGEDPSIPNPRPFVETDPADESFLGETCRLWEASMAPVTAMGKRFVILRTGIVLSREGGALAEFKKPVKLGVAAILGSGRQAISWIHIQDLCRMYLQAIEQKDWRGVYNAVAPNPVDNRAFTRELAARLKGRFFVPVYIPSFILRIVVGEMSIEVLKSTTVSAKKARQSGFQFIYPSLESALSSLV